MRSFLVLLFVLISVATTFAEEKQKAKEEDKPVKAPMVEIIGTPEALERIPGSGAILDKQTLETSRVFTTNEALRKLPGINVRDEEGFGLRPNIGIRGLNPTRSTKITLLEDGVPLSYAPYGDNASYYHPPIERYQRIEVMNIAKARNIPVFMYHSCGVCTLRDCLNCLKNTKGGEKNV